MYSSQAVEREKPSGNDTNAPDQTTVNIELNYNGNTSRNDVLKMVDLVEKEIYQRANRKKRLNGVR
jgi:hypothetical protein